MRRSLIVLALIPSALCTDASVGAQSTFTTPPGYETPKYNWSTPNPALSYMPDAGYSGAQFQRAERNMPAGKMTLTRLQWRTAPSANYDAFIGMGRSFTQVKLMLGYTTKTQTFSHNFAKNWDSTPTTVFAAAWSVPSVTGRVASPPWGNAGDFPFSTPFAWDSSKGMLLQDWTHAGGKLVQKVSAGGSWPYYLDAPNLPGAGTGALFIQPSSSSTANDRYLPRHYWQSGGGGCNDSAMTDTRYDAYADLKFFLYADQHHGLDWAGRGNIRESISAYTAPGAAMLGVLSAGGSDVGVDVGAMCNKLHVNMGFPVAIVTKVASTFPTAYTTNWFDPNAYTTPWDDNVAGTTVYWQVAWANTANKALALTNAVRIVLPKKPIYTAPLHASYWAYAYDYRATTYTVGPWFDASFTPIERWTRQ